MRVETGRGQRQFAAGHVLDLRRDRLGGLRLVAGGGFERDLVVADQHPQRGVALGHQGDALDRGDDLFGLAAHRDGRLDVHQMPHLGELARKQPGGQLAVAAVGFALETDQPLTGIGARQRDRDGLAAGHRARGLRQDAGGHQGGTAGAGRSRTPAELLEGHPVAVGGQQRQGVALDLDAHAGEDRQQLIASGRHHDLVDRLGELLGGDGAGGGRHLRQRRVVGDRQHLQGEAGRAADQFDAVRVGGQVDRTIRQAAGDLAEQASRNQGLALVDDLGLHSHLGTGLVVEARHRDAVGVRLDQQAGQDRN